MATLKFHFKYLLLLLVYKEKLHIEIEIKDYGTDFFLFFTCDQKKHSNGLKCSFITSSSRNVINCAKSFFA